MGLSRGASIRRVVFPRRTTAPATHRLLLLQQSVELFFDLAQTRVEQESQIKNQHFEAGDIIFHQGDLGDSVYVIEQGEAAATRA